MAAVTTAALNEKGHGAPVDGRIRGRVEADLGVSLGPVRVHTDANARAAAERLGARAFTCGTDVFLGQGERPNDPSLLAHELAHVAQQRAAPALGAQGSPSEAHEADAHLAAGNAMAALFGDRTTARAAKPALRTGLSLQRCSKKHNLTDPFVLTLDAKLRATPPDKLGVMAALRGLAGSKAGNSDLRDGIDEWQDEGLLTHAEMFRAVCLLEIGEERLWPTVVTHFAEGADRDVFDPPVFPPAGKDALREYAVRSALVAAEPGTDVLADYRRRFSSKWDDPSYAGLATTFDSTLDSKGPKNERARHIFKDLYADAAVKSAYDGDFPKGFRNLCDTLAGPEGLNLLASSRIQELRAALSGPSQTFTGTADPAYAAFVAAVRPKAQALDGPDRIAFTQSHSWRLIIDARVAGTSPAVAQALRDDLWTVVTTSLPPAPALGGPPLKAPPPPPPSVGPPPTVNAAQAAFLTGIGIAAPPAPQNATTDKHPLTFDVHSAVPNPALAVRRRVVVEPAAQVIDGQDDQTDWPNASSAVPHTAHVNPDSAGGPPTTFTARLTLPPLPSTTFPEKTASVAVNDKRIDWFRAHVSAGVVVTLENAPTALASGGAANYFGGQLPLSVAPALTGGPNPGLNVHMEGTLTKNGAPFLALPRREFPAAAAAAPLFNTILTEAPGPPPPYHMELTINFFSGAGAGALFHTIVFAFDANPALPVVVGGDAGLLTADETELNKPIGTAGTFLYDMYHAVAPGTPQALVAEAASAGSIKVRPCIVRSDSSTWLTAHGKDPAKQVAYALGQVDDAHTLAERPGAIGWQVPGFAGNVFLNLTPNTHTPAVKRSHAEMAGLLAHEGIHSLDRTPGGNWGQYLTEFRAYWVMGMASAESTAVDPSMSNFGPKSPRARAIFNFLYRNQTYPFVKADYDANTAGFREEVDNYLYPDGINLMLSIALSDLRKEIESFTGTGYALKKAAIQTKYTALTPDEQQQIRNNRRTIAEPLHARCVAIGAGRPGERHRAAARGRPCALERRACRARARPASAGLPVRAASPRRGGAGPREDRLAAAAELAYDLSAPFTAELGEWNPLWLAAGALTFAVNGVLRDPQAATFIAAPGAVAAAQAAVASGNAGAASAIVSTRWGPLARSVAEQRAREQNLAPPGLFTVALVEVSGNHPALVRTVGDAIGAGDGRARSAMRDARSAPRARRAGVAHLCRRPGLTPRRVRRANSPELTAPRTRGTGQGRAGWGRQRPGAQGGRGAQGHPGPRSVDRGLLGRRSAPPGGRVFGAPRGL